MYKQCICKSIWSFPVIMIPVVFSLFVIFVWKLEILIIKRGGYHICDFIHQLNSIIFVCVQSQASGLQLSSAVVFYLAKVFKRIDCHWLPAYCWPLLFYSRSYRLCRIIVNLIKQLTQSSEIPIQTTILHSHK